MVNIIPTDQRAHSNAHSAMDATKLHTWHPFERSFLEVQRSPLSQHL